MVEEGIFIGFHRHIMTHALFLVNRFFGQSSGGSWFGETAVTMELVISSHGELPQVGVNTTKGYFIVDTTRCVLKLLGKEIILSLCFSRLKWNTGKIRCISCWGDFAFQATSEINKKQDMAAHMAIDHSTIEKKVDDTWIFPSHLSLTKTSSVSQSYLEQTEKTRTRPWTTMPIHAP